jgi:hypothetical protein
VLEAGSAAGDAPPDADASPPAGAGVTLQVAVGAPGARGEHERALAHGVEPGANDEGAALAQEAEEGELSGFAGGLRGSFGRAFERDVSEIWFGRLEVEGFGAGRFEGAGPAAGVLMGGEYWRGDDAAGGGMPVSFWFGYRSPVLFSSLGFGLEMFIYDEVAGDGGFGLYAPFATACVGVEIAGFRLLGDFRATHRWQWGADDRGQIQVGVTMTQFIESPGRPPPKKHGGTEGR